MPFTFSENQQKQGARLVAMDIEGLLKEALG